MSDAVRGDAEELLLLPPPLPAAPMPTLDIGAGVQLMTPAASGVSSPAEGTGVLGPIVRKNSVALVAGLPRSPGTPLLADDASSDEDAGYFKAMGDERPVERGLFRLRKNSSVKHSR
ncbi:hypothetical protein LPJ73_009204 [Coemansia sp. RSA 2703]|nr:hypothetical protein LPJ73_009204 [Coemansia sp. RSA 2703]